MKRHIPLESFSKHLFLSSHQLSAKKGEAEMKKHWAKAHKQILCVCVCELSLRKAKQLIYPRTALQGKVKE